jgi:hypothetical protein
LDTNEYSAIGVNGDGLAALVCPAMDPVELVVRDGRVFTMTSMARPSAWSDVVWNLAAQASAGTSADAATGRRL